MSRWSLIGALAALAAGTASAQSDPSGLWEFRTDILSKGCTISGVMTIAPQIPGESARVCEFVSTEVCGEDDPTPVTMDQACQIAEKDGELRIRSRVVGSLTEGRDILGYLPDHFNVSPDGPNRMIGIWFDDNYVDTVEFWRARGGASS